MRKFLITIIIIILIIVLIGFWIKVSIVSAIERNVQEIQNFVGRQIERIFSIKNILPF